MSAPSANEILLLSKFSYAEREALALFRDSIQDLLLREEQQVDSYLIRWIRARDHDLTAAENMLRTSLKWRTENDIDNVLTWPLPPEFQKHCSSTFLGYNKDNSPVLLLPLGSWDLRTIFQIGEKLSFIRYIDQLFERSLQYMKGKRTKEGYPVTQFQFIIDCDGFSMKTLASFGVVDMVLQCVRRFESNQPETLKSMFMINASYAFTTLYSLMKPLLSEKTFGKIQVHNTNAENWREILRSHFPQSILPPKYGGTTNTETAPETI